jgi:hypothetical protein
MSARTKASPWLVDDRLPTRLALLGVGDGVVERSLRQPGGDAAIPSRPASSPGERDQ